MSRRRSSFRVSRPVQTVGVVSLAVVSMALAAAALTGFGHAEMDPVHTPYTGPRSTVDEEPEPAPIEPARAVVTSSDPLVVAVLGDSTGNDPFEWVALWANSLAVDRAVTVHGWDDQTLAYGPETVLSTVGPEVEIWNMSAPGRPAGYAVDMIRKAVPERPDLVIYNYGHNNTAGDIGPGIELSMDAIRSLHGGGVESVLIAQNPSVTDLAERQEETVWRVSSFVGPVLDAPVIDVFGAFAEADVPVRRLLLDGTHPNEEGQQLWADTVTDALGPQVAS